MVTVPDLESPFRRKARGLLTPAARRFDPSTWTEAFEACSTTTSDDAQLLTSALWTGREMHSLAATLPDPFPGLAAAQAVTLGVASLNLEFVNSQRAVRDRQRALKPDTLVGFDYYSHLPYENASGQQLSQSDFMEAGVEAIASWLFDARAIGTVEPVEHTPDEVYAITGRALNFYSLQKALKNQFDKALHQGARIVPGAIDDWEPYDRELERLRHAWQARSETDIVSAAMELRAEWPALSPAKRRARMPSRTVTGARAGRNGSRLVVGRRECLSNRPPYPAIDRRAMENSYFSCFLDDDMPLAPGLSVARLAAAWWVIRDAARQLVDLATRTPALHTAGGWAAAIRRDELVQTIAKAIDTPIPAADAIVRFLTFGELLTSDPDNPRRPGASIGRRGKGDRGLWAAPLVFVPGEQILLIPTTVFELGSFIYRVEAWLERGGIDDEALEHRGDRYERVLRRRCAEAITNNLTLSTARVAPDGVARSATFPHQIDLLLRLGNRVIVGEVKCLLTPADPHQWDRFLRTKLPAAARQARDRAEELRRRPDVVASALGMSVEEAEWLSVEPIVVLNIGAGFSLRMEGCRVVHADFLLSYLRGPVMESGSAVRHGKPTVSRLLKLYENERDAGDRFDSVMADPWPLRRFLDRLQWQHTSYPRPSGGTFTIGSPARGNLTSTEMDQFAAVLNVADHQV